VKIIIDGTGEHVDLVMFKAGEEVAEAFITESGGMVGDQFISCGDAYRCDQATFDWWAAVLAQYTELHARIEALAEVYGMEMVQAVIDGTGRGQRLLVEHAARVTNAILDEAFCGFEWDEGEAPGGDL
jgi:hypothetical protein